MEVFNREPLNFNSLVLSPFESLLHLISYLLRSSK